MANPCNRYTATAPVGWPRVEWFNPDLINHLGGERVLNPVEEYYIIGLGLIYLGVKWAILDFFYEAIAEI